jgi:hypothetical protein
MMLLGRAWPDYLGARLDEARNLSQLLGDDHDLAMLVAFVHSDAATALSGEPAALIERAARERQAELRAIAKPCGQRLFAAKPKGLRRSIGIYWHAAETLKAKELAEGDPAGDPVPSDKRVRRQSAPRRRAKAPAKAPAKNPAKV